MLFELIFALLPVTLTALIGGIMALCLVPWALMLGAMQIIQLLFEGQLPGRDFAIVLFPLLLAAGGLVGTFSLWAVFLSRFRGSDEFTDMPLVAHGVWLGVLALFGVHMLVDTPLRATTSWEVAFLLLVAIRLWWLAQPPAQAR